MTCGFRPLPNERVDRLAIQELGENWGRNGQLEASASAHFEGRSDERVLPRGNQDDERDVRPAACLLLLRALRSPSLRAILLHLVFARGPLGEKAAQS